MSSETTIGDRIKHRREEIGFSMQALAEAVGVSAWQTVQQWENGSSAPARKRLSAVAEALGVTAEYLMFGDDHSEVRIAPMADEATLRDYFAAKALARMIENQTKGSCQYGNEQQIAARAYAFADAMIAERAK